VVDVAFDLEPGATLLIVGPSGSGKSTLALAIAGLVPRDIPATVEGELRLDGRSIGDIDGPAVAARVGIVFQDPTSQLVMERVEDDVAFGLENRGWPADRMHRRVPEALAAVGLDAVPRQRSRTLSGGQQQRLALSGVLAARPGILVLDEPTANLDPAGAAALARWLARLREARSTTTVLIEHRVAIAWPLADVVLALGPDGRTIDIGPPTDVLARSARPMREAGIWLPAEADEVAVSSLPASTSGRTVLTATDLTFGYDPRRPVLHDTSLEAAEGERIALVGPNGSGKSTLARLLVGLLRPDRGHVELLGDDPARLAARDLADRAAYVFQEPERQFLATSVLDEVTLGLDARQRGTLDGLMTRLGLPLDRFAERSPYRLSGGEQRRLSLACALVRDPRVLVLDEPTFGQDRLGYEGLIEILGERLRDGTCLIAATHDERFVTDVASRIVHLERGRITSDEPAGPR
jgi:energy-coupling factor transport system ATP-binding protein